MIGPRQGTYAVDSPIGAEGVQDNVRCAPIADSPHAKVNVQFWKGGKVPASGRSPTRNPEMTYNLPRLLWAAAGAAVAVVIALMLGFSWWGATAFAAIMGAIASFVVTGIIRDRTL